jgi:CHAT domain-containing protein
MVPWPALIDSDNNYLIEKYSVSLVGTGRDLLNKAPTKGISTGVIVADPDYDVGTTDAAAAKPFRRLPGTAREAKEVALHLKKIAGGDPTVLMGAAASEVAVKELHNVSVLVLSTHGFYLPIPASAKLNPLLCCGLALKGANHRGLVSTDDDGILTGMEVVGINLEGTKLVVLSACDTGVGQLQVGEGVAGLRQAFQLAGAEAVVASLWPVADEETATLMGRFFKHQATSRQYADALRQAQLEFMDSLKRERGAAHPILWAAFSVMSATP